eukprot:COSAG05_NODE_1309_length_5222_cov_9.690611_3_plen_141_part_00
MSRYTAVIYDWVLPYIPRFFLNLEHARLHREERRLDASHKHEEDPETAKALKSQLEERRAQVKALQRAVGEMKKERRAASNRALKALGYRPPCVIMRRLDSSRRIYPRNHALFDWYFSYVTIRARICMDGDLSRGIVEQV